MIPPGLPWVDPTYSAQIQNAGAARSSSMANLLQQRGQAALDYGYTPTYDANGFVKSLAVDPNNPYSKASLLSKTYKENRSRNLNSFANRGQLYAGSLGVAQSLADQNFNQGSSSLQNSFINFIARNQAAQGAANENYNTSITNAYGDALGRYVPPEPPGSSPASPGATAAPKPDFATAGRGLAVGGTATFSVGGVTYTVRKASTGKIQVKNSNNTWRNI